MCSSCSTSTLQNFNPVDLVFAQIFHVLLFYIILRRIMLRTAGFIMHIFATCFQAITVQSNCYANFALIKGQCEAWEVSFFRVHFQATVIRTCSLCRMKKKNLRLQPIKSRVSLAWKPNWLPYHHVFEALAHRFDARSSARPTVSQNSDLEEDFLPAENVDVFDPAVSVISL